MKTIFGLCGLLVLAAVPAARGEETTPAPSSDYRRVMQAQYAAHTAPEPARPEEAQRIYDSYLKSIGQPARDNSIDAGSNTGVPSR